MASIDDMSNMIGESIQGTKELTALVQAARQQALELAERLDGMNAEGMAKVWKSVADSLEGSAAQAGLAASKLETAMGTADSARQV